MTDASDDPAVPIDVASARRAPAPFELSEPPRRERTMSERIRRLSRSSIERPGAVTAAVVLLWLLVAAGFVGLAIGASLVSEAATAVPALWLVIGAVAGLLVVEAIVVAFVARGARWARITLTVLVVARVLLPILGGAGVDSSALLSVVVLVLLYLPRSNDWFAAGAR